MSIQISISAGAEHRLLDKAREAGLPPEALAAKILEEQLSRPSIEEILRPLREQVAASGISEDELGDLLEKAKHEMQTDAAWGRAA